MSTLFWKIHNHILNHHLQFTINNNLLHSPVVQESQQVASTSSRCTDVPTNSLCSARIHSLFLGLSISAPTTIHCLLLYIAISAPTTIHCLMFYLALSSYNNTLSVVLPSHKCSYNNTLSDALPSHKCSYNNTLSDVLPSLMLLQQYTVCCST